MPIKISESDFAKMKAGLHYNDKLASHQLVVSLSEITYQATCIETKTENKEYINEYFKA